MQHGVKPLYWTTWNHFIHHHFCCIYVLFCSNRSSITGHIYLNKYHCLYFECRCSATERHTNIKSDRHRNTARSHQTGSKACAWHGSCHVNFFRNKISWLKINLEKLLEVRCTSKSLNPHQHQQSWSVANSAALQLHWAALRCKLYECAVGIWRREADMQTDGKSPILTSECAFSSVCKEEAWRKKILALCVLFTLHLFKMKWRKVIKWPMQRRWELNQIWIKWDWSDRQYHWFWGA